MWWVVLGMVVGTLLGPEETTVRLCVRMRVWVVFSGTACWLRRVCVVWLVVLVCCLRIV